MLKITVLALVALVGLPAMVVGFTAALVFAGLAFGWVLAGDLIDWLLA